ARLLPTGRHRPDRDHGSHQAALLRQPAPREPDRHRAAWAATRLFGAARSRQIRQLDRALMNRRPCPLSGKPDIPRGLQPRIQNNSDPSPRLVRSTVATPCALAAKQATTTIPIVMAAVADPSLWDW